MAEMAQFFFGGSESSNGGGTEAWVTLATNDTYAIGCMVLGRSLRRTHTTRALHCLVTTGVTQAIRTELSSVFDAVSQVDVMDSGDAENLALIDRPELGVTFTKLHCWRLTQYTKCVFLDADTMLLDNCDELFEHDEFSAAPDIGWPDCFNSGVFVFHPCLDTYRGLLRTALEVGSFDGGDQGLLNEYFSDWRKSDVRFRLSFIYNMSSGAIYTYAAAYKRFGALIKIVHFLGTVKPWHHSTGPDGALRYRTDSAHQVSHIQQWWDIFNQDVKTSLAADHPTPAPSEAQHTSRPISGTLSLSEKELESDVPTVSKPEERKLESSPLEAEVEISPPEQLVEIISEREFQGPKVPELSPPAVVLPPLPPYDPGPVEKPQQFDPTVIARRRTQPPPQFFPPPIYDLDDVDRSWTDDQKLRLSSCCSEENIEEEQDEVEETQMADEQLTVTPTIVPRLSEGEVCEVILPIVEADKVLVETKLKKLPPPPLSVVLRSLDSNNGFSDKWNFGMRIVRRRNKVVPLSRRFPTISSRRKVVVKTHAKPADAPISTDGSGDGQPTNTEGSSQHIPGEDLTAPQGAPKDFTQSLLRMGGIGTFGGGGAEGGVGYASGGVAGAAMTDWEQQRQWEEGRPDYLGRDSFENIQRALEESLSKKSQQ